LDKSKDSRDRIEGESLLSIRLIIPDFLRLFKFSLVDEVQNASDGWVIVGARKKPPRNRGYSKKA
jgi:hypothetical protein